MIPRTTFRVFVLTTSAPMTALVAVSITAACPVFGLAVELATTPGIET